MTSTLPSAALVQLFDHHLTLHCPANQKPTADALWLAALGPTLGPTEVLFEAGLGTGVVALTLLRRCPGAIAHGLECQPDLIAYARTNAQANPWASGRLIAHHGDIATIPAAIPQAHHSIANLPFYPPQHGSLTTQALRAQAWGLGVTPLTAWLDGLSACTQPGGTITLLAHRDQLPAILTHRGQQVCRLVWLQSHPTRPPKRVVVTLVCGGKFPTPAIHHLPTTDPTFNTLALRQGQAVNPPPDTSGTTV